MLSQVKFGSVGDSLGGNVVGVMIVQDEYIAVATSRGNEEWTSLI